MASTTPPVNHSMAGRDGREESGERRERGRERERQGKREGGDKLLPIGH